MKRRRPCNANSYSSQSITHRNDRGSQDIVERFHSENQVLKLFWTGQENKKAFNKVAVEHKLDHFKSEQATDLVRDHQEDN